MSPIIDWQLHNQRSPFHQAIILARLVTTSSCKEIAGQTRNDSFLDLAE